jgi:hypothetical protein
MSGLLAYSQKPAAVADDADSANPAANTVAAPSKSEPVRASGACTVGLSFGENGAALSRLPVLTRAAIHLPCGSAGLALEEASTFADQCAEGFSSTVSFAILPVKPNGTW